jgi:hypothetical protein
MICAFVLAYDRIDSTRFQFDRQGMYFGATEVLEGMTQTLAPNQVSTLQFELGHDAVWRRTSQLSAGETGSPPRAATPAVERRAKRGRRQTEL